MHRICRMVAAALAAAAGIWLCGAARAADPPPIDAYGSLPAFEDAAISPTGNSIAIVAQSDGERKLMLFGANDKLTRALAVGDTKIRDIEWIGDDAVLMVTSVTEDLGYGFTTSQAEFVRGLVVPAKAGEEVSVVFGKNKAIVGALFGEYGIRQVDGEWAGFFGGIRLAQRNDTQSYHLEHTRPALIAFEFGRERTRAVSVAAREGARRSWLVDGNGAVAATLEVRSETGNWEILGPKDNPLAAGNHPGGAVGLVALGRDGTTVVYSAENDEGYSTLFEAPLDGSAAAGEILADNNVVGVYRNPANGRLIGFERRATTDEQVFFDKDKQDLAAKIRRAFKGRTVSLMNWTPDFSHLIVRTSGNEDSGSWYLIKSANLEARFIGEERPLIGAPQVGPVSTFAYKAGDGLDLDGILTLPPGREAKGLPVVILPHGGPGSHDEQVFDWWAQAYAARGYAVFQPNFRGSTNRDQEFQRAGYGQWGRKMQTDISDGLAALAEQGTVDPKRACIVGASYGGYAALAGVTLQQGLYRCAVSVAGVSDLNLLFKTENAESNFNRMVKFSLLEELGPRSGFKSASPREFAARADAPILLIHGRDDTVVPYEQSAVMADALKDAGKPYRLVDLREEDHWLSRGATRVQMLEATMAFVQEHNPAD